jgi:hypothetical protein
MTTLVQRAREVRGSERGSMPMLLLVILVGVAFGALLIPMVITQDQTTRYDNSRTHSLHAAEAGIDTVLGMIRATSGAEGTGDPSKLPCGPFNGSANDGGTGTYSASLAYYTADPAPHSADPTWLDQNKMICIKGYGVYDPKTKSAVPSYALVTSAGSDGPGLRGSVPGRTLQSTYVVKTTNSTIAGGVIRIFPPAGATQANCMDAGTNPVQGAVVRVTACDTSNPSQLWSYHYDLSIQLVASVTDQTQTTKVNGNGLCLDSANAGSTTVPTPGTIITLQYCAAQTKAGAPDNTPWDQKWSSGDGAEFRGALPTKSDVSTVCLNFSAAGQPLTVQNCSGGTTNTNQTWLPSPRVGSGAAGLADSTDPSLLAASHQLVNFEQFSRCLDVTNENVSNDYEIVYPCKQNPSPGNVKWNQKWAFNSKNQWVTNFQGNVAQANCLTAPGAAATPPYVTLTACPIVPTPATTWTTRLTKDSSGAELAYRDKFTIVSSTGLCLSLSSATDLQPNTQNRKVTVATCDGSAAQKWNALPDTQNSRLQDTRELPYVSGS